MTRLAFAHPGKIGDALYTLPTIKYLCGQYGATADFYTSDYCAPLESLFEYQSYIDTFYVAEDYKIERMDMGVQPWYVPIPDEYDHVFQLGFQRGPNQTLHQFIAAEQGIHVPLAVEYEYPELPLVDWNGAPAVNICDKLGHSDLIRPGYVVLASRHPSSFDKLFYDISIKLRERDIGVVQIGGRGEYIGVGRDATEFSLLATLSIMSQARGFVGLMSSQLVLANGFSFPKIAPHDGRSWDMSHVIKQASNHYPIYPTADQIIELLGI